MDKQPVKFVLPSPNFNKLAKDDCKPKPHFLTPSGMSLLPREKQPPPMYGKHGATVPARYLQQTVACEQQFVTSTLPEKQYCEPCELELQSLEDLKRHRAQHEKCPAMGCQFKGHPSVMDKHVNALHVTGLFDKFKKLSTPEEIAAWREERRKRYPTLANVLLKQKAQEQRQKRGERLEASRNRFGKINDRKRAQPNKEEEQNDNKEKKPREDNKPSDNNKRNRKNKRNKKPRNQEQKPKVRNEDKQNKEHIEEDTEVTCNGIKMFQGTSQLKNYKHFKDIKKIPITNPLFGLLGMYGSDDGESDDGDNEECNTILASSFNKCNNNSITTVATDKIDNGNEKLCDYTKMSESSKIIVNSKDNSGTDSSNKTNSIIKCDSTNDIICKENISGADENILSGMAEEKSITQDICETNVNIPSNSNDKSSDEAPEETPIQRTLPDCPIKGEAIPNLNSNDEPAEKRSKILEQPTTSRQKLLSKRKSGLDYRKARLRKQNTMLEKLLESDIRHERNVLLQCVRYVCENKFFGIGENNQRKPG